MESFKVFMNRLTEFKSFLVKVFPNHTMEFDGLKVRIPAYEPMIFFAKNMGLQCDAENIIFELHDNEDFDLVSAQIRKLVQAITEYSQTTPIPPK